MEKDDNHKFYSLPNQVDVWAQGTCQRTYQGVAEVRPEMMCASKLNKDSCSGDSGGPLVLCHSDVSCTLVGVASWGVGCADNKYPGVYTRIGNFAQWITDIVQQK